MTDIRLTDTRGTYRHYSYWEMLQFEASVEDGTYFKQVQGVKDRITELISMKEALQDMAEDLPSFWEYSHVTKMCTALVHVCGMLDEAIKVYKKYLIDYALLKQAADEALNVAHQHPEYCFKVDAWTSKTPQGLMFGKSEMSDSEMQLRSTTNPFVTCPQCNHYHRDKKKGWHINLKAEDIKVEGID